jgi:GNAT superfamily N-acetyltransferase
VYDCVDIASNWCGGDMLVTPNLETRPDRIALADVFHIMTHAPWATGRTLPQVEEMMRNTPFVVLASIDGEPVGFARAISDNVFRAFIEDVIVTASRQGCGIGTLMICKLEEMIRSKSIPRIELVTQQSEFWKKVGFRERQESRYLVKWMTR